MKKNKKLSLLAITVSLIALMTILIYAGYNSEYVYRLVSLLLTGDRPIMTITSNGLAAASFVIGLSCMPIAILWKIWIRRYENVAHEAKAFGLTISPLRLLLAGFVIWILSLGSFTSFTDKGVYSIDIYRLKGLREIPLSEIQSVDVLAWAESRRGFRTTRCGLRYDIQITQKDASSSTVVLGARRRLYDFPSYLESHSLPYSVSYENRCRTETYRQEIESVFGRMQ